MRRSSDRRRCSVRWRSGISWNTTRSNCGQGERLCTIQPDYIGQGSRPIQWGDLPTQLIRTCTTGPVQAFYDGYGRRVKVLHELRRLWTDRTRTQVSSTAIRLGTGTSDLLAVTLDARTYVFGPTHDA